MKNKINELQKAGIVFEQKSPYHLVVEGKEAFVDYWPTTGTWICRLTRKKSFGLKALITYVKE